MSIARDRAEIPHSTKRLFSRAPEVRIILSGLQGLGRQDSQNCSASPDNAAKKASGFLSHHFHGSPIRTESGRARAPPALLRSQRLTRENTGTPCSCSIQTMNVNIQTRDDPS